MNHSEEGSAACRVCGKQGPGHEQKAGICHGCLYKIGISVLIVMIIASYIVWFGLL
jgi:hypothetical protein